MSLSIFLLLTTIIIALCCLSLHFIKKCEELEEELMNAETRAVTHFRKVNKIEKMLKYSNDTKENYFITLDKINRVIFPTQTDR